MGAALAMWMRGNWPGAMAAAWAGSMAYLTALACVLHSDLKERLDKMEADMKTINKRLDHFLTLCIQDLQARSVAAATGSSAPKVRPGNGPGGRGGRCQGLGAGEAWPEASA